ncbi:hypothetical protein GGR57DRAFT_475712 [Xylariaceae sp. FL1272]|nr:hypothetical protein GGR57DRAFT_475712 [Xylariaceae sp. FL1272]
MLDASHLAGVTNGTSLISSIAMMFIRSRPCSSWLLFALNFFACFYSSANATCFNVRGDPWSFVSSEPVEEWLPCNSTAEVTNCCGPRDYCMGNGLCMDAVVDNFISQQGCTSEDWEEPCHNWCKDTQPTLAGLVFLWKCDEHQTYCCSSDTSKSCCSNEGVDQFVLKVGLDLHHPPKTTTTTKTSTSTTATDAPTSTTSTSANAANSTIAQGNDTIPTSNTTATSSHNDHNLAIGLGVGGVFGLGIIAAICFLSVQIRRKRKNTTQATENAPQNYLSDPYKQYHGFHQDTQVAEAGGTPFSELETYRRPQELPVDTSTLPRKGFI